MPKIKTITAREILSSSGLPTLQVAITLSNGAIGTASVPYGASAGKSEAVTLVDGDSKRFAGVGMLKAAANVNQKIAPKLVGKSPFSQQKIDQLMIDLDGTENKKRLGGNAILAVSLALARAGAATKKMPLYQHLRQLYKFCVQHRDDRLPKPMLVLIEGGKHASGSTDFQEYLIAPQFQNAAKNIQAGVEVYWALKKILEKRQLPTTVGSEGAFAPSGLGNEAPWPLLVSAIKKAGYRPGAEVALAADLAASEIYKNGNYQLKKEKQSLTAQQLIAYLKKWLSKYPLIGIEDPLSENDWSGWTAITGELSKKVKIIADDLTVTNRARLQKALDCQAATGIIIKPNQVGTLTETVATIKLAKQAGWWTVVSHRGGGETNDTFITDLAVAFECDYLKVGISRGERVAKWNRLLEIEHINPQLSSCERLP